MEFWIKPWFGQVSAALPLDAMDEVDKLAENFAV